MTRVVPGNVFQENRFIKTEQQSKNSENEVNVSQDILTPSLKKASVNETQAKSPHGTSLSTHIDHSSDDQRIVNHMMMGDENQDEEGESDPS